jgi:hypothetical protein
MDEQLILVRNRHICSLTVTLIILCAQYAALLMAASIESKAKWNEKETDALLDYLFAHKSEMTDGGTFRKTTFNAAALHIAEFFTDGAVKTGSMCKTKWQSVCSIYLYIHFSLILSILSSGVSTTLYRNTGDPQVFTGTMKLEQASRLKQREKFSRRLSVHQYVLSDLYYFHKY